MVELPLSANTFCFLDGLATPRAFFQLGLRNVLLAVGLVVVAKVLALREGALTCRADEAIRVIVPIKGRDDATRDNLLVALGAGMAKLLDPIILAIELVVFRMGLLS
jgi:hypothetical protein